MEKIKRLWRSIPIRFVFVLTTLIFVSLATFATSRTNKWAMENMLSISQTYHYNYSQNGNDVIYNIMPDKATLSEEDRASYNAYQAVIVTPLYSGIRYLL